MERIIKKVYKTYECWKEATERDKKFYEMYIGMVAEEAPSDKRTNIYNYWESLKNNTLEEKSR